MQARALARRGANGSFTLLGDIAQGTTPWAVDDWQTLLHHFGKPDAQLEVLDRGYRVPAQIVDYASRLLADIAPGIGAPTSARTAQGSLQVTAAPDLLEVLAPACREALAGQVGRSDRGRRRPVGHPRSAGRRGSRRHIARRHRRRPGDRPAGVCPGQSGQGPGIRERHRGRAAHIVAAEARGFHRLYVVLTRRSAPCTSSTPSRCRPRCSPDTSAHAPSPARRTVREIQPRQGKAGASSVELLRRREYCASGLFP